MRRDPQEYLRIMREAKGVLNERGWKERVMDRVPGGMQFTYVPNSHPRAYLLFRIYETGHESMIVWQVDRSDSDGPDFVGINPEFKFVEPAIEAFFDDIENTLEEIESEKNMARLRKEAEENARREAALAYYTAVLRERLGVSDG